ncbi:hypothetical protein [Paracoccus niistensis]|uniref:Uncharacterized protein n=1 Tax=Paracoccus niistensis TaxID=632935 RepID=A0ABV6I5K9_9RHOB
MARIDVLPSGWCCTWPFSVGAVFSGWETWSYSERIKHLRDNLGMLVKEFGVSDEEIGTAFRLVPELAKEPEARAACDSVTVENTLDLVMTALDGRRIRF